MKKWLFIVPGLILLFWGPAFLMTNQNSEVEGDSLSSAVSTPHLPKFEVITIAGKTPKRLPQF
ncbi:hypothetical protein IQ241_12695 [Romeria aff. gracilis LEGE 07310]|uniref:Uncharacterized protein n=1 Tax=Vasconcelosia minhoensis LEGE 07310 TaxID=915328 RepID=A0A8J7AW26_9CYAN|nr:hypothetical protein [Romeria gracilis]MBE9078138.1 hypothetical protein [Romeria aff. gracilis LEGE 07310]